MHELLLRPSVHLAKHGHISTVPLALGGQLAISACASVQHHARPRARHAQGHVAHVNGAGSREGEREARAGSEGKPAMASVHGPAAMARAGASAYCGRALGDILDMAACVGVGDWELVCAWCTFGV
jgi:hypothetical protein